jgi:hypothetical protein
MKGRGIAMYCVVCGSALMGKNGAGLVCTTCKPDPRANARNPRDLVITVAYCCRCGQPYRPADKSVQHPSCFPGEMMTGSETYRSHSERRQP